MSRQYDGKKKQRRFGIGKYKDTGVSKRKQLTYSELSNKIKSTDNLKVIRALILSYVKNGGLYPKMYGRNGERNITGDCNNDGSIDILDIVEMINYILGTPSQDFIFGNCDMNGDGDIDIIDVVQLVNLILTPTDNNELPSEPSITDLADRVYYLQYESSLPDRLSFSATDNIPLTGDHPGYEIEESSNPNNKVLITAPHAQAHYRPTRWNSSDDPSSGLLYCDYDCNNETDDTDCSKSSDWCTGAMAKTLAEYTNATVIYTRYKQMDPNYYDRLGIDWRDRTASQNIGSGNEIDTYFPYGGIQTPGFYDEWVTQGINGFVPFKQIVGDYLNENPNIQLVIDLHGMSTNGNHQDVDLGLLGNNGSNGTESIQEAENLSLTPQLLGALRLSLQNNYIGVCDYDCPEGINANDSCVGEPGCMTEGICSEDNPYGGHGPISYNDFAGANQYTVTKFVREYFPNVFAVQVEMNGYYRCLSDSNPQDVGRMMNALGQYVNYANDNL
tara:strand:+ start:329 stop:1831 length:1503 start_codon:yes stop_codon:yes gene_type:complete